MNLSAGTALSSRYTLTDRFAAGCGGEVRAASVPGARGAGPLQISSLAVIGGARTSAVTATIAATPNQNTATTGPPRPLKHATATEIASPVKDSHMPGQTTTSQAAAWDHHQSKDGKQ